MGAPSPSTKNTDLVSFAIKVNGSSIPDTYGVQSIYTEKSVNKISNASIVLLDGDPTSDEFDVSDSVDFIPGNEIEILAGYHNKNDTIFKGIITTMKRRIRQQMGSVLVVECRDKAFMLTNSRKNRHFKDKKDSEAITTILSEYKVTKKIEDTKNIHPELVQYYVSDWDFILTRSEINGKLLINNDNDISVADPEFSSPPKLSVSYGESLLELDSSIDGEEQIAGIDTKSWDIKTQKVVTNSSIEPRLNKVGNIKMSELTRKMKLEKSSIQSSASINLNDLKTWANSSLLKSRMNAVKGHVKFQGNSTINPGENIEIKGVGARFEGNNFVTSVEHNIINGEWTTNAKFGLSTKWHSETPNLSAPSASGLIPPISGLHTGKVIQLDKDPSNQFRILVKIPLLEPDIPSIWARLSQFYANKESGVFFFPEIDDEVIISFINNDPRFPIILGSLYSGVQKPAEQITEKNFIKSILTKAKLKLSFDDEKKIIILETPGGNSIEINDDGKSISLADQNSNKLILDSNGISIDSGKDIKLSAKGEINISAMKNVVFSAKGDIKAEGTNINNTAKVGFVAKGSASAEISAAGQTVVKGAMVMIN